MKSTTKAFASRAGILTRRGMLATVGLTMAPVAITAAVVPSPGVPVELADLARSYATAEALAARTDDDDDIERAEDAEREMMARMRAEGIKACVVDGKLFMDAWKSRCESGGASVALADVRGL